MLNVWPIYLQNWVVLGVNVGKYTSPIEHLGKDVVLGGELNPSSLPGSFPFQWQSFGIFHRSGNLKNVRILMVMSTSILGEGGFTRILKDSYNHYRKNFRDLENSPCECDHLWSFTVID